MRRAPIRRQRPGGFAAVEFAAGLVVFMYIVFTLFDIGRAVYYWNTMAHVTRTVARAAIVTGPNSAALATAKANAIMAGTDGNSTLLGSMVTVDSIKVSYLDLAFNPVAALPANGNVNVDNCQLNAASASCIRFVQVQMCAPNTDCTPLQFKPVLPYFWPLLADGVIKAPSFLTILPVQGMGCTAPCL
jgi:Flp pilus assembly protein TadG